MVRSGLVKYMVSSWLFRTAFLYSLTFCSVILNGIRTVRVIPEPSFDDLENSPISLVNGDKKVFAKKESRRNTTSPVARSLGVNGRLVSKS